MLPSAERISNRLLADNVIFLRHLVTYEEAAKMISGDVLELGSGEGYGIPLLAEKAKTYLTVDKYKSPLLDDILSRHSNVRFQRVVLPDLSAFAENTFDWVISFQVIEHIIDDEKFVREAHRVLKPGGTFMVATPNSLISVGRNPFHIREYKATELNALIKKFFPSVSVKGMSGNAKVKEYYRENKKSVARIKRFDIFDLEHRLPAWLWQIPYQILNRVNRSGLFQKHRNLVENVSTSDFFFGEPTDDCIDLVAIAVK